MSFWLDDCVRVGPLCLLHPKVFRVVSNNESSVSDCYSWGDRGVSWVVF